METISIREETALQSSLGQMQLLNEHLAGNNPFAIAKIESNLSVRKSIETGTALNKMGERFGHESTMMLLTRLIEYTASFFNVNGNLTDVQLVQIVQAIIDRFGHDNIEDIVLALKDARMGLCGKVYGRIDGEIIIGWIEQYMDKKADELEKLHKQQKNKMPELDEQIARIYNEIKYQKRNAEPEIKSTPVTAEIWLQWFEENKLSLSHRELKSIRDDLQANNIFRNGIYENCLAWIENELYKVL